MLFFLFFNPTLWNSIFRVPNKLVVLWQRGAHRRRYSKPFDFQPGIAKPYRGVMVWAEEEELDMTCTLYKVCNEFFLYFAFVILILTVKPNSIHTEHVPSRVFMIILSNDNHKYLIFFISFICILYNYYAAYNIHYKYFF